MHSAANAVRSPCRSGRSHWGSRRELKEPARTTQQTLFSWFFNSSENPSHALVVLVVVLLGGELGAHGLQHLVLVVVPRALVEELLLVARAAAGLVITCAAVKECTTQVRRKRVLQQIRASTVQDQDIVPAASGLCSARKRKRLLTTCGTAGHRAVTAAAAGLRRPRAGHMVIRHGRRFLCDNHRNRSSKDKTKQLRARKRHTNRRTAYRLLSGRQRRRRTG